MSRTVTCVVLLPLLPLLLAAGCEEPDHWEVRTDNGGASNGGGGAGSSSSGGTVITIHNGSGSGGGVQRQPALVNAPVAPEAIYFGCGPSTAGVGVIDLNGFGQGTGDVTTSRFPHNPNIGVPGVQPPLAPGVSSLDAGGAGVLTLTQDTAGSARLLAGIVADVADMQLGQPLDLLFHNGGINPNATSANQVNPATGTQMPGNTIMVAPHPNPPRLVLPPPNPALGIECEEPTVASTVGPPNYPFLPTSPPCIASPLNQLTPGNPFSTQPGTLGIFGGSFPGVFYGPQPPPPPSTPPVFGPFVSRQQIGQFLYVLDRGNRQVAVFNSNRFTPLSAIAMADPVDLAMSPNLERLAVSNGATGEVVFVDTVPTSATFQQIVARTAVGAGVGELAWQPEGEDLLALNPRAGTLTLIDGVALRVRKVVARELRAPRALAVTARQTSFGNQSNTWYAFVLNGDGSVAVFESGPAGPNGIGYDDVLGTIGERFAGARALVADPALGAGFWVAHRDAQGLGQVSQVQLTSSPAGQLPLSAWPMPVGNDVSTLPFRQKEWTVVQRFGGANPTTPVPGLLSGNAIVDLAFDDIQNQGALPDQRSALVPGLRYRNHSGKGLVKLAGGNAVAARLPRLLFVALDDTGTVDVLELATGNRLATLPAPGVRCLCDYWRQ